MIAPKAESGTPNSALTDGQATPNEPPGSPRKKKAASRGGRAGRFGRPARSGAGRVLGQGDQLRDQLGSSDPAQAAARGLALAELERALGLQRGPADQQRHRVLRV